MIILKKLNRKSIIYLSIVLLLAILVGVGSLYFFSQMLGIKGEVAPKERSMKEIIQGLTAPGREATPVSEEVMRSITAPWSKEGPSSVPDDVLKNLTAPE